MSLVYMIIQMRLNTFKSMKRKNSQRDVRQTPCNIQNEVSTWLYVIETSATPTEDNTYKEIREETTHNNLKIKTNVERKQ